MTAGAVTLVVNVVFFSDAFDDVVTLSIKVVFFVFSGPPRHGNGITECRLFVVFEVIEDVIGKKVVVTYSF